MYNGCVYASVCLTKDCSCRLDSYIEIDQNVWNKLKAEMETEDIVQLMTLINISIGTKKG